MADVHKWLVFFSAYYVMVVNVGFYYSFGTLFPDIMAEFGSSRAETAVIQSTLIAVGLGSGLLNGVVIHKFGLVKSGLYGSVISSVGIMACFFATSVGFMIISIGIVMAFGFSCMFISSSTAIGQHFKGKKRLLMLSIQGSGAGIGGMIYPYLLRFLSNTYGMRGTLLIVSAIFMNSIPGCLLWGRPVDDDIETVRTGQAEHSEQVSEMNDPTKQSSEDPMVEYQAETSISSTEGAIPAEQSTNGRVVDDRARPSREARNVEYGKIDNDVAVSNTSIALDALANKTSNGACHTESPPVENTVDILHVVVENGTNVGSSSPDASNLTLLQSLKQIFKNRTFILYLLGGVTSYPALGLMMVFVVDIFLDKDFTSNDAAFGQLLLSALNVLGRFVPGILMQSSYVSTLSVPMLASVISTIVFPCLVVAQAKWLATFLCALTGLSLGMFVSIYSVTTVKLVGQERLPNAMGLLFSANSIGNAIAGPVCGYLRDITGTYSIPLYAGAAMSFSGVVCYTLANITRRKSKYRSAAL